LLEYLFSLYQDPRFWPHVIGLIGGIMLTVIIYEIRLRTLRKREHELTDLVEKLTTELQQGQAFYRRLVKLNPNLTLKNGDAPYPTVTVQED
jgi:hypothetical protein